MAKYGLFYTLGGQPLQVYEGDSMTQDKQFVKIWKQSPDKPKQLVAAIHLNKGESIKKISD
ncbi:MAG: hypothetical protein MUP80_15870 [Acidobacteriia bacterium]|nr:hypothetical protein [Terriglobia bacterium]